MEVQPLLRALGRHCPLQCPAQGTHQVSVPGSLGADPFSPQLLSLGGSSGSLPWEILMWFLGPLGLLGWHEEAANPSAADEVPPLALRIPPCAWGICSSSCQQHPPHQHQAPHSWSCAWGSAGSRGLWPWHWGQFPLLLPAEPNTLGQAPAPKIVPG